MTKEELLEKAKELDVEGRSGMNKEELEKAVAEAEAEDSSDEANDLSPSGQDALDEMGDVAAAEADLALDASGPLYVQSPSERIMTGAISEEHAMEQETALAGRSEDSAGTVTEAGFNEDGSFAHLDSEGAEAVSDPDKTKGELRASGELKQEDVIDYEAYRSDQVVVDPEAKLASGGGFGNSDVAGGGEYARPSAQKAVFYTDGTGGAAEQNLERAYNIPELLQSVREAGDESESEGAEKSTEDKQEVEEVKSGSRVAG